MLKKERKANQDKIRRGLRLRRIRGKDKTEQKENRMAAHDNG
jgi:hypothetical protein